MGVKLGTNLPEHLIGTDHGALAAFLQALEGLGFGYVTVGDHVLGADLSLRPGWRPYLGQAPLYDQHMPWHEPMVLFGFLAGMTTSLELSTGILVAPQRQAALLAKQAAEVDVLSGGRLRLVVATGWNDVEYEALGVPFRERGRILEEQVTLLRRLWTEEVVTYEGRYHTVTAAGINPLPVQRPVPLWFGGQSQVVLRRTGRLADGWFPYYPFFSEERVLGDLEVVRHAARDAGRDPAPIGIEGAVYFFDDRFPMPAGGRMPPQTLEECVEYAHTWKRLGASRYWVTAPWADLGPEETGVREPGRAWQGVDARIVAMRQFRDAVGADF
jgi:probable F420-dependent oxidoreductase